MKTLPRNAKPIWDARVAGKKPAGLVCISLIGRLNVPNPTVYADADTHPAKLEWRWVRDLSVVFVHDETTPVEAVKAYCIEIAKHLPNGGYSTRSAINGICFSWHADQQTGLVWDYYAGLECSTALKAFGVESVPANLDLYRMSAHDQRNWLGLGKEVEYDYA